MSKADRERSNPQSSQPSGGVTLLLRGLDRAAPEPVSPVPEPASEGASDARSASGSGTERVAAWIPVALFASDAVMIGVATLWAVAGYGSWRWLGIALLLVVGCVQAVAAWRLRGGSAASPPSPTWLKPASPESVSNPARVRVHFVDELPRNRR
jgi:hypothetical protein